MNRQSVISTFGLSRRTALGRGAAVAAALSLGGGIRHAAAQDAAAAMATHPLVGTWLSGTSPTDLSVTHWDADGGMLVTGDVAAPGPGGMPTYSNPAAGVWEPDGERGIHITFTFKTFDATGAVTGTVSVEAYPVASEDGESFRDDGTRVVVTLRDAAGMVGQVMTGVPPVTGVRMRPGKPGYDEILAMFAAHSAATPETGTPTG
jgi:hypothetical protein